jgi:ankyrin repeat protein
MLLTVCCQFLSDIHFFADPDNFCISKLLHLTGIRPLVYDVLSENAAVVKYLLDHGADPNKVVDDGLTPLHSAAGIGRPSIELILFCRCRHTFYFTVCTMS